MDTPLGRSLGSISGTTTKGLGLTEFFNMNYEHFGDRSVRRALSGLYADFHTLSEIMNSCTVFPYVF